MKPQGSRRNTEVVVQIPKTGIGVGHGKLLAASDGRYNPGRTNKAMGFLPVGEAHRSDVD